MATMNGILATLRNAPQRLEEFTYDYRAIEFNEDSAIDIDRNGYVILKNTLWGDYCGDLYTRHMYNVMSEAGHDWMHLGYGARTIAIHGGDMVEDIALLLDVLTGYLYEYEVHETEHEIILESWDGYLEHSIRRDIEQYITGSDLVDLEFLPDSLGLLDMVYEAMSDSGEYWVIETAASVYIPDHDALVADIGDSIMAEYMQPNVLPGQATLDF